MHVQGLLCDVSTGPAPSERHHYAILRISANLPVFLRQPNLLRLRQIRKWHTVVHQACTLPTPLLLNSIGRLNGTQ